MCSVEELIVSCDDVRPGDVLIGFHNHTWKTQCTVSKVETRNAEFKVFWSDQFADGYWITDRKILFRVLRISSTPSTHWNGTCFRCGKNTYTGAWKVEHDGPCVK